MAEPGPRFTKTRQRVSDERSRLTAMRAFNHHADRVVGEFDVTATLLARALPIGVGIHPQKPDMVLRTPNREVQRVSADGNNKPCSGVTLLAPHNLVRQLIAVVGITRKMLR